jgi:phosphoribosylformylglycinamidine cyclo-ligase
LSISITDYRFKNYIKYLCHAKSKTMQDIYKQRGVSADKEDVHIAIKNIDKGLFPNAFCKILPDYVGGDDDFCNLMHADTAGTKTAIAYIYYKETGDLSVWKGIVQDALVMNIDDMLCAGVDGPIVISSTIARNNKLIDGAVISTIINAAEAFAQEMKKYNVQLFMAGGETADVGDIVRTIDVGYTAFARLPRTKVVDPANIKSGQVIVGLASYGQATYETSYNSGMGSNGLTSARHDLLNKIYLSKYPETVDPLVPEAIAFAGPYQVTDNVGVGENLGKLLLSPTRTFAPVMQAIFANHRSQIAGIIHNTGGGASKCLHYVPKGLTIVKDNLLPVPEIFTLIQKTVNTSWEEMYKVFNMGTRLEIYTDDKTAQEIIAISKSFNIDAQIIGKVEANDDSNRSCVDMQTAQGNWKYWSK